MDIDGYKSDRFKVFDGETYKFYQYFESRRKAIIKGEELKLAGDCWSYKVLSAEKEGVKGYNLWIH